MINYQTIQKLSKDVGIDESYIRTMIKNKDLTAYKKGTYKRIYIDINEFNQSMEAINPLDEKFNLEDFEV